MILEKFFNFLDVNIHHKRIARFLINYNIETVIDIGSHKGEFLENLSKFIRIYRNVQNFIEISINFYIFSINFL